MNTFQPGCPWYDLHQQFPPNVDWCEAKICSWILTPFNFWTNLAYVFAGLFFLWRLGQGGREKSPFSVWFFGYALIGVGIASGIYHASLNLFTQTFDFFGMYLFLYLILTENLRRKSIIPNERAQKIWFIALTLTHTVATLALAWIGFPIQIFVGLLTLGIVITELLNPNPRKYFWMALPFLILAAAFSAMDVKRIFCDPENHWLQGHGIWHIFSALALTFMALHFQKILPEKK